MVDEEKNETNDNNDDVREEETENEIRDEDYREDDIIEMLRELKENFISLRNDIDSVKESVSAFVDNGAVIREDEDISDTDDFADDFVEIEDMDLSVK